MQRDSLKPRPNLADPPRPERLHRLHHAAQFGETLQPADAGIAGVHLLADVVDDGSGRGPAASGSARRRGLPPAALLLAHAVPRPRRPCRCRRRDARPRRTSRPARGVTLRRCAKWMCGREFLRHGDEIVLRIRAEGAGAQRQPVGLGGTAANIARTSSAFDTRAAGRRSGRADRPDGSPASRPSSSATGNLAQEGDQVGRASRRAKCPRRRSSTRRKLSRS